VLEAGGIVLPRDAPVSQPLEVMLAFHGASGSGPRLAERLTECANRSGMVVVAPSMLYRDYMDPEQVRLDDQQNLPRVLEMLDNLQSRIGVPVNTSRVMVYGFSRGGQMAHRFALFYPERVSGVAALAAGNYTLPKRDAQVAGQTKPLAFPYGVADLQTYTGRPFNAPMFTKIPFWIGIGAADSAVDQVPHAWDSYIGNNRLERARRFTEYLKAMGVRALLDVFNGTGHEETVNTRQHACDFLSAQRRLGA